MNTNRLTEAQNNYARAVLAHDAIYEEFAALTRAERDIIKRRAELNVPRDQADEALRVAREALNAAIVETSTPKPDREQFWQAAAKPIGMSNFDAVREAREQAHGELGTLREALRRPPLGTRLMPHPHRADCDALKGGPLCTCDRGQRIEDAKPALHEADCEIGLECKCTCGVDDTANVS